MFQGIFLLFVGTALSLPAAAQELNSNPDTFLYTAQTALLILGMAFAGYWAYEGFDTPPIKLGDGPTLPRYDATEPISPRSDRLCRCVPARLRPNCLFS